MLEDTTTRAALEAESLVFGLSTIHVIATTSTTAMTAWTIRRMTPSGKPDHAETAQGAELLRRDVVVHTLVAGR